MLLALAVLIQDLDALAARLAAEDVEVRGDAEKAILDLPGRLLPATLEALGRRAEPEARALEDRIRAHPSWIRILPGSLRDVRARVDAIGGPQTEERSKACVVAHPALAELPPGEAAALLVPLLAEPADPARIFAMMALRRHPPPDPAPLMPFLDDVRTSGLAAEVLIVMGARTAVPRAVDLFVAEGGGMLGAARILEAFGAGGQAERIARAVREKAGLLVWGIRILRATGADAEPQLIALAPDVSYPRRREIAEALAEVGGPRSLPLLREISADLPAEERDALLRRFR
jgi:HEAT repeat protein